MNNLKKLLTSANEFYQRAIRSYRFIKSAQRWQDVPDVSDDFEEDTGLDLPEEYGEEEASAVPYYNELIDMAHSVEPGLGWQLEILAELYKKAIMIGGGYATIAKAISAVKDLFGDELDINSESVLNSIMIELAQQAGGAGALAGRDNQRFVQQLLELKQNLEMRGADEQAEKENAYQMETHVPGALQEGEQIAGRQEEEEKRHLEYENEKDEPGEEGPEMGTVFDSPGGKEGDKINIGKSFYTKPLPKDMVKHYKDAAKVREIEMAGEPDPKRYKDLKELAGLYNQVAFLTDQAQTLYDNEISPMGENANPKDKEKLAKYHKDIEDILKKKVYIINRRLFDSRLKSQIEELKSSLATERDPKLQELYKQKIALHELTLSNDRGKTAERNARLQLIRMMSGGNFPGAETLQKQLEKINQASAKRIPFEAYDAARKKKYQEVKEQNRNVRDAKGLVFLFSEKYSSYISDQKKLKDNAYHNEPLIVRQVEAYKTALKVSITSPSPENENKKREAEQALAKAIDDFKEKLNRVAQVKELCEALTNYTRGRYSKPRSPWFWLDEIPEDKKTVIQELIIKINSVNTEFNRVMPWTELLNEITVKLKEKISPKVRVSLPEEETKVRIEDLPEETETEEETPSLKQMTLRGHMNKKQRKDLFEQLTKKSQMAPEPSKENIDQYVEEETKKLFDMLWDNSKVQIKP